MRISYNKLWKLLIDKDMTKMELKDAAGISAASIAKLGKGSFENLRNPSLPHRGYP